ncbi:hypothetical protein F2Q69_00003387 [Brassica cretica]|uniref:Uncharacterized protein n=1 Tax=Brassica cretica TaxID=69181 RepID=A0A8S9PEI4_BRACR|nr:hypothetical protein F2Q69_00003387 [Brassica cretica]
MTVKRLENWWSLRKRGCSQPRSCSGCNSLNLNCRCHGVFKGLEKRVVLSSQCQGYGHCKLTVEETCVDKTG